MTILFVLAFLSAVESEARIATDFIIANKAPRPDPTPNERDVAIAAAKQIRHHAESLLSVLGDNTP